MNLHVLLFIRFLLCLIVTAVFVWMFHVIILHPPSEGVTDIAKYAFGSVGTVMIGAYAYFLGASAGGTQAQAVAAKQAEVMATMTPAPTP